MHLFTQPSPEKPCNNFLFSINDNCYVNALNVIIYLLSCYPDHASEITTISMLEVFHRIVRDWAVVWAQQGVCIVPGIIIIITIIIIIIICIVPGIINNPEACCPLGKEVNCTWPSEHFLPVGKTWWSHWKQIPYCIIGLHHHNSRTVNSWGQ